MTALGAIYGRIETYTRESLAYCTVDDLRAIGRDLGIDPLPRLRSDLVTEVIAVVDHRLARPGDGQLTLGGDP